jgi:hypothetical protein
MKFGPQKSFRIFLLQLLIKTTYLYTWEIILGGPDSPLVRMSALLWLVSASSINQCSICRSHSCSWESTVPALKLAGVAGLLYVLRQAVPPPAAPEIVGYCKLNQFKRLGFHMAKSLDITCFLLTVWPQTSPSDQDPRPCGSVSSRSKKKKKTKPKNRYR